MTRPRAPATALLALLLGAGPLAAQEIAGVAMDSTGRPLPEVPVALHRVGGGSGATVAATTTDAEGRFQFFIEVVDSAVYFVAMRHADRMYIGPPARGGVERITDYEVRADAGSEAGAVASALSGDAPLRPMTPPGTPQPSSSGAGAVWFVGILALVVAVVFVTTAPTYRRRRKREALVELATLENRLAGSGTGADAEADRRRLAALRERLAPRS